MPDVYNLKVGFHRLNRLLALSGALLVCACGSGGSDWMPLAVGKKWNFKVKAGFETYIDSVAVTRELSVANRKGYELAGPLGVSRLAWVGDSLLAEKLVGTQFIPPLPILFDSDETHERPWKGRVIFVDRSSPATASQSQKADDDLMFAGRKIHCTRSTVRLKTAAREVELITWFSRGLGIVRQEQRTNGTLLVRLDLLDEK